MNANGLIVIGVPVFCCMWSDVHSSSQSVKTHREVSQRPLTSCQVVEQTALSLSALEVPCKTTDYIEWASIQARDGQIHVGGVVRHVGDWAKLVYVQGILDSLSNRDPGYIDAVIAGRVGGEKRRMQNCGGEESLTGFKLGEQLFHKVEHCMVWNSTGLWLKSFHPNSIQDPLPVWILNKKCKLTQTQCHFSG